VTNFCSDEIQFGRQVDPRYDSLWSPRADEDQWAMFSPHTGLASVFAVRDMVEAHDEALWHNIADVVFQGIRRQL